MKLVTGRTREALAKNVESLLKAGKPIKQAEKTAYSIARSARAGGGPLNGKLEKK